MKLSDIPSIEDDRFEFKSSATSTNELKKKIGRAVSGFANSGGGVFLAGIDNNGKVDNGYPKTIGNTSIRDWVDQIIQRIEPIPQVTIHLIDDVTGRGVLQPGHILLAIEISPSLVAPHMAPDAKYYIRAGAHTLPARHFIVEGIWSRRNFVHPRLVHRAEIFDYTSEQSQCSIEIIAITDSPALDVEIDVSPRPDDDRRYWPRRVPLIDRAHAFKVGIEIPCNGSKFDLSVGFHDVAGNQFTYAVQIDSTQIHNSYKPFDWYGDPLRDIARALDNIESKLQ